MRARPVRLNVTVALLFMIGSSCFTLGATPAYASAVGSGPDLVTFFVGSLFFTSASFGQLLQAQTPAMIPDAATQKTVAPLVLHNRLPADRNWLAAATQFPGTLFFNVTTLAALVSGLSVQQEDRHVWRPDFVGSLLFLIASTWALLALEPGRRRWEPREFPWWIAWVNLLGSGAFMASAIASYVIPTTGSYLNSAWSNGGTFVGAICFFIGAALMVPAWRAAVRHSGSTPV